jgi:hypothetical protein
MVIALPMYSGLKTDPVFEWLKTRWPIYHLNTGLSGFQMVDIVDFLVKKFCLRDNRVP